MVRLSDAEIDKIILDVGLSNGGDRLYGGSYIEKMRKKKALAGVMYLYRLAKDEMISCNTRFPFPEIYQGILANLTDLMGKRRRAVKVFEAIIEDYEKRGILTIASKKKDFKNPFEYRGELKNYYNEDSSLVPKKSQYSTTTHYGIMMARCLFAQKGKIPNYARLIELIFFSPENEEVDVNAKISVPKKFIKAVESTKDVEPIKDAFGLEDDEVKMLQCSYNLSLLVHIDRALERLFDTDDEDCYLYNCFTYIIDSKFSIILDMDQKCVRKALSLKSKCCEYNLYYNNGEIIDDVRNAILTKDMGVLFKDIIERDYVKREYYPLSSFQVKKEQIELVKKLLCSSQSINFLLYGPAGTGKTEFARSIVKACGLDCYFFKNEVELEGEDDISVQMQNRLRGYMNLKKNSGVLIVDEAENLLLSSQFNILESANNFVKKGSVNKMIDYNCSKIIWILNYPEMVDKTTLRRMTYSIKMPNFSPLYLQGLVEKRLEKENLSPELCTKIAELSKIYKVSLSTLDYIVKAIKTAKFD